MSDLEKINIYVPEKIGKVLSNDVFSFEILKRDMHSPNWNRFLNMLLLGYYDQYITEYQQMLDTVMSILQETTLTMPSCRSISQEIVKQTILPGIPPRKGKNPKRLSLKPTNASEWVIQTILSNIENDYLSQYFCRMLVSYCVKPFSERERIVFHDNYGFLSNSCKAKRTVSFTTIWAPSAIHTVVPYTIAIGSEERFNYLLCGETNPENGEQEARSYRLNRICNPHFSHEPSFLEEQTIQHLNTMLLLGPQYMINDDIESCVRMTAEGERSYQRIYNGRPIYDRVERKGDYSYYYFKGSKEQILFYFKRFGSDEAEILSPPSLREKMTAFHKNAAEKYL